MDYAYSYFFISGAINAIVSLALGLFVFFYYRKNNITKTLAMFCFGVGAWSIGYMFWPLAHTTQQALLAFQILHIGACYVSIFYLHFVITWLDKVKENKKLIVFGYVLSTFFASTTFTSLFIKDMVPKFNMKFWANPGILYHFYLAMFFSFAIYASILLIRKFRQSEGLVRKQTLILLLGIVIAFLGGSTNYFLWYDINIPPWGNGSVVFFVILTVYSIAKHKLFDIKLVMRRSVVYFASLITILIPTIFVKWLMNQSITDWSNFIILILAISIFTPLRDYYYKLANKYFFSSLYDSREVIQELNEQLRTTLDIGKVYGAVTNTIQKAFHTRSVAILMCDKSSNTCKTSFSKGFSDSILKQLTNNKVIFQILTKQKEILTVDDEIDELLEKDSSYFAQTIRYFDKQNIDIISPLHLKNKVIGYMILSRKESGDIYNKEDLQVLEIINTEVAIAIENSLLYEETKAFNITLTKQIAQATRKLRVQNKKLQSIDKIKTDFISTASHQLRTPLTATKWALSSVQKKCAKLDKTTKETFKDLTYSNQKLIKLVNELLNISRIDEGRLKIEPVPTDIVEMLKQMVKEYTPLIKKMKLKVSDHYDKMPKINLDGNVIQKALSNLLSNAIKYNRKGKKLIVEVKKDKTNAYITVADQGIGIPKAEQDGIFKKFYRASNAATSNTEGSGLGLYIAMQALKQSGGKVQFESKENVGTTFYVTIPLSGSKAVDGEKGLV